MLSRVAFLKYNFLCVMDFSIKVCFVCALIPITDILVTRLSLFGLSLYIPLYILRGISFTLFWKNPLL